MKDREEIIAFTMRYCQHYDSDALIPRIGQKTDGCCHAGVNYEQAFGSEPGIVNRMPCTSGGELTHEELIAKCPKWLRKTREQGEERADHLEASMNRMRLVMPVVKEWRSWSRTNRVAKQEIIECPACKGRLHLSQAAYNGHVWGQCETDGCVNWME